LVAEITITYLKARLVLIINKSIRGIAQVELSTLLCSFIFIGMGTLLSACDVDTPTPRLENPTPPVEIAPQEPTVTMIDGTELSIADEGEQPTEPLQTATIYPLEQIGGSL
jgi:hypothetical protein